MVIVYMGIQLFDQYTYLHFAAGIVSYFWGVSLIHWIIVHIIFEVIENTQVGIKFINTYFTWWPGGKPKPDSLINSIGDTFGAFMGWISAYYLDHLGNTYKWYPLHISKNR